MERISIHALREEGDQAQLVNGVQQTVFLSTPSARRATGFSSMYLSIASYFYPRPPRGGRRDRCRNAQAGYRISIHALREEGDPTERR